MKTQASDKKTLLASIDEVMAQLQSLMSSLDPDNVNRIPYQDSWTAGQLFDHIIKSTKAITRSMDAKGKSSPRDPGEKIPEIKKVFLDFLHKLKSPDFIIPEKGPYDKQTIMNDLKHAVEELKTSAGTADLVYIVEDSPIGPATKLEMLHFVWYHTQRHLHQMRKICTALQHAAPGTDHDLP